MALNSPRFSRDARLKQAAENHPPLRQGEQGEAVAIVQQALIDLQFAMPGSTRNGRSLPDGIYGPETARVVARFQARSGLAADGIIGRQTLRKLDEQVMLLFRHAKAKLVAGLVSSPGQRRIFHRTLSPV